MKDVKDKCLNSEQCDKKGVDKAYSSQQIEEGFCGTILDGDGQMIYKKRKEISF